MQMNIETEGNKSKKLSLFLHFTFDLCPLEPGPQFRAFISFLKLSQQQGGKSYQNKRKKKDYLSQIEDTVQVA